MLLMVFPLEVNFLSAVAACVLACVKACEVDGAISSSSYGNERPMRIAVAVLYCLLFIH